MASGEWRVASGEKTTESTRISPLETRNLGFNPVGKTGAANGIRLQDQRLIVGVELHRTLHTAEPDFVRSGFKIEFLLSDHF